MHIALVNLTGGGLSGGYRKYLGRMAPLLAADPRVSEVSNYIPADSLRHVEHTEGAVAIARSDARLGFPRLRRAIARTRPDVVFVPTARTLRCAAPTVVMVRNMEPLLVPFEGNRLGEGARNLARALSARWACVRSNHIIAVSEHVREFLERRWSIRPDRISVVYHGVDGAHEASAMPPGLDALDHEPFLFTAGSIRPARGLEDIVRALPALADEGRTRRLVIAGNHDGEFRGHYDDIRALARDLGVADRVFWAGQLSPPEMAWCFQNAELFVMTSRAEACPNIALEAMSHGARTVSTDHDPMPEFFGQTAIYYRARQPGSLASAVRRALGLPHAEVDRARQSARETAGRFRWQDTATRTVDALARACGKR